MKQKIQTTKAASFLSDDVNEIIDEPLQSSLTTSQQESTHAQSRWKSDKHITKTKSLLVELETKSQQMMVLHQRVLESLTWTKKGTRSSTGCDQLSMIVVMRFGGVASTISSLHYQYIAESDGLKRQQIFPATIPPIPSVSKQSNTSIQRSSQTCSAMWQPPPSTWPNQPSSSVYVWQSQDGNLINQQFRHQQQPFPQLHHIRLSSSKCITGTFRAGGQL